MYVEPGWTGKPSLLWASVATLPTEINKAKIVAFNLSSSQQSKQQPISMKNNERTNCPAYILVIKISKWVLPHGLCYSRIPLFPLKSSKSLSIEAQPTTPPGPQREQRMQLRRELLLLPFSPSSTGLLKIISKTDDILQKYYNFY